MKGTKSKKEVPASPRTELSRKADETNLKRKKASYKEDKASKRQTRKDQKAKKDPNKPKRPPTPFFVFLEEFRKTYKANNPTVRAAAAVGKAGGDKWKSMSAAEKAPYVSKAEKKKAEYEKLIHAYNEKGKTGGVATEESDKSRSEINDEEEEEESTEDAVED